MRATSDPTFNDNAVIDAVFGKGGHASSLVSQDGGDEPDESADDKAAPTSGQNTDSRQKRQIKGQENWENEGRRDDGPNRPQHAANKRRRCLETKRDIFDHFSFNRHFRQFHGKPL